MTARVPMTDRARRVVELSAEFAGEVGDSRIEAEHLLFGLVAEGDGLAAKLLTSWSIYVGTVRTTIQAASEAVPEGTVDAGHSLDQLQRWAHEELAPLSHNFVGTEHLLLSLTHVERGRGAAVLDALGLDSKLIRSEVYSILGHTAVEEPLVDPPKQ